MIELYIAQHRFLSNAPQSQYLLKCDKQVLALESAKWPTCEGGNERGSTESGPILPQPKRSRGLDRIINMLMETVNRVLVAGDEEGNEEEEGNEGDEEEEEEGGDPPDN